MIRISIFSSDALSPFNKRKIISSSANKEKPPSITMQANVNPIKLTKDRKKKRERERERENGCVDSPKEKKIGNFPRNEML
jgi:hypothetical protein